MQAPSGQPCDLPEQLSTFLAAHFEPENLVEVRPIEVWFDDGKKRTRPLKNHRAWLKPAEIIERFDALMKLTGAPEFANIFFSV